MSQEFMEQIKTKIAEKDNNKEEKQGQQVSDEVL